MQIGGTLPSIDQQHLKKGWNWPERWLICAIASDSEAEQADGRAMGESARGLMPSCAMKGQGGAGVCNPRRGVVVQPPSPARPHRRHAPGKGAGKPLSAARPSGPRWDGPASTKPPPRIPARFRPGVCPGGMARPHEAGTRWPAPAVTGLRHPRACPGQGRFPSHGPLGCPSRWRADPSRAVTGL